MLRRVRSSVARKMNTVAIKKNKWLWLIPVAFICLFFSTIYVTASGLGGYISEKLIKDGVDGSLLTIGSAGTLNPSYDVAMSGTGTVSVSNIYMDGLGTHATLHGNLVSLNGFNNITCYFQWGYDTTYGHTTASQVISVTGVDFTQDISGYDPSKLIYVRLVMVADGTNYASTTFNPTGSPVAGFVLLNAVVLLVYAAFIIIVILKIGQESTIGAIIFAAVAIYIGVFLEQGIQSLLNKVFGG